jgi:hypothetical protein
MVEQLVGYDLGFLAGGGFDFYCLDDLGFNGD